MSTIACLRLGILAGTLALACIKDKKAHKIPNFLTTHAVILGLALAIFQSGWHGLGNALEGLAIASISFVGYATRALGAGDIKLLWAVGALTGPLFVGISLLATALSGGVIALCLACCGRKSTLIPYAFAIAAGAVITAYIEPGALFA